MKEIDNYISNEKLSSLDDYITEKLKISKDSEFEESEIVKYFQDEDAMMTLKFVLNLIRRSKVVPYSQTIFAFWDMHIKKHQLYCMHSGWSRSLTGYSKSRYIERCVDNYNRDNGTNIKTDISGWSAEPGISIFKIKEVVDALKNKFTDFKLEDESEVVSVL